MNATAPQMKRLNGSVLEQSGGSLDRLPSLPAVLDDFAINAATALQPLFGALPASEVLEIKSGTLFDTLATHQEALTAVVRCDELDSRLAIIFADAALETILLSSFSIANEDTDAWPQEKRPMSAIDRAIATEAVAAIARGLEDAFAQAAKAAFRLERLALLSDMFALGRRDMPVVIARLAFGVGARRFECATVLPQTFLQPLRQELASDPPAAASSPDPRWSKQLELGVTRARLTVSAILDEYEATLHDLASYKVGDVLPLSGANAGRVKLECERRPVFWASVRSSEGRYTLEIEKAAEHDAGDLNWP